MVVCKVRVRRSGESDETAFPPVGGREVLGVVKEKDCGGGEKCLIV